MATTRTQEARNKQRPNIPAVYLLSTMRSNDLPDSNVRSTFLNFLTHTITPNCAMKIVETASYELLRGGSCGTT